MGDPKHRLDTAAYDLALAPDEDRARQAAELAAFAGEAGAYPASIGPLYRALAHGDIEPLTVPAFNMRGLTYDLARAIWRAAQAFDSGPIMFELAPSEAQVCRQPFDEFAALVLAAAVREGYHGPVFLQGDHFQVAGPTPDQSPGLQDWCQDALAAGVYQIDLDAAELTDAAGDQAPNARATAATTAYLREREAGLRPGGADLVIGGEVSAIGGHNTSPAEVRAFMLELRRALPSGTAGLGKLSVQTGTSHGGIVMTDGQTGSMPLNLQLVAELATMARAEFGLPGVVQHGASTLSLVQLARLPDAGVCEVHLATFLQNLVFDHAAFPADLRARLIQSVQDESGRDAEGGAPAPDGPAQRSAEQPSAAQHFYRERWTCWGSFKAELWDLPEEIRAGFRDDLATWAGQVVGALRVAGRRDLHWATSGQRKPRNDLWLLLT